MLPWQIDPGRPAPEAAPWTSPSADVHRVFERLVPCEGLAVGLMQPPAPRAGQVLSCHGLSSGEMLRWCGGAVDAGRWVARAVREGVAAVQPGQPEHASLLGPRGFGLLAMIPDALPLGRWWWLLAVRRSEPFEPAEQKRAALWLRRLDHRFHDLREPGMIRLLIDHERRLVLGDLEVRLRILSDPGLSEELSRAAMDVLPQRCPDLPDHQPHDLAVRVRSSDWWITLCRLRSLPGLASAAWHLEARPLHDGELPVVGSLPDDRVARAVAYLHTHFAQSPSLAVIARQAHMSAFHFHRLFSKQVGVSPKHYLQCRQLHAAKWMLRHTRRPIGQIAHAAGFASHGHFTSTFHRQVGQSPSDYRDAV